MATCAIELNVNADNYFWQSGLWLEIIAKCTAVVNK